VNRSKVIAIIKREGLHVNFWQETHLSDVEYKKLKLKGFKNTFYSSYKSGRRKGVAISLNYQLKSKIGQVALY
jgi:hypothetical protein